MPVRGKPRSAVRGTLDRLILKTRDLEPRHGCGIGLRLPRISGGLLLPQDF